MGLQGTGSGSPGRRRVLLGFPEAVLGSARPGPAGSQGRHWSGPLAQPGAGAGPCSAPVACVSPVISLWPAGSWGSGHLTVALSTSSHCWESPRKSWRNTLLTQATPLDQSVDAPETMNQGSRGHGVCGPRLGVGAGRRQGGGYSPHAFSSLLANLTLCSQARHRGPCPRSKVLSWVPRMPRTQKWAPQGAMQGQGRGEKEEGGGARWLEKRL